MINVNSYTLRFWEGDVDPSRRKKRRARQGRNGVLRREALELSVENLEDRRLLTVIVWDGTPDGGGSSADANWTTADNWAGDVAPTAGDNLIFATGVTANLSNTNDFADGTTFGSIQLLGSNYVLGGTNGIALAGGISNSGADNQIDFDLTLGATLGFVSSGNLTLGGEVDLNGNNLTLDIISNTLTLNDQLTGAGDLTKQGGGTATLESDNTFDGSVLVSGGTLVFAGANQYTGTTTVNSATLRIGNSMSLGSADSTAATGTTLQNNASLQLEDVGTIVDEHLKITSSGITAVYLYNLSGDNVWEENIQLEGVAATRFYVTSGSLDVGGDISGSSYSVEFQGNGNGLQLSGDNVHSVGNTADIFGTVMVSGSLTTSGGPLRNFGTLEVTGVVGNLQNNGTLEVTGTVGNVSANSGTIRGTGTLGNVPSSGTLTPGAIDESGVLDTGNLSTSGTYVVDLDGDTAGDGTGFHDQLNVTGTVSVAGTLQVTVDPGYTPLFAHEYVIIANDDTDAVSGNFSGLTEGGLLVLGTHAFSITYQGGDGNDVVLERVPVSVWDGTPDGGGSSADANWTTADNWAGDVAPTAGDNLIFATGVTANLSNTNDFADGTAFGSIQLLGSNYVLGGTNGIALAGGISNSGADNQIDFDLTLGATLGFVSSGNLTLGGEVDLNGNNLTLDIISNTLTLNDQLTGAGDLTKQGGGTATLESDNTFDGSVLVSGGTLVFAGANQYTGTTTVNSATLRIGNSMSLGSADSTAATGTTLQNNASLQLEDVGTIVDEHLKITSSGITAVYLYNLSGDNVWEENIQLEGVAATRFYVTSGSLDVGGDISGSSYSVEFQGNGNGLQLSGDNVHSVGNTADIFGTVMVSGSLTTSGGPLRNFGTLEVTGVVGNLQNNGTLEVTGTVGNVSANSGTIRGTGTLGNVPSSGTLTPGAIDESGVLDTGNLSTSGTYVVDLDGDTAGDGTGFHDQLNVTGTVSVAGTLQVTVDPGYTPLFAHEYVIIANDDTDAVSGNFSGLTEGGLLVLGTHAFSITYQGGDGNDVVLERVPVSVWDGTPDGGGSSADANWTTADNWAGDVAPTAGDNLIFATGVTANLSNTNDFADGTAFGSIQLLGSNYVLGGTNGIALAGGISNSGADNQIDFDLTLGATLGFVSSGNLTLGGEVDLNGNNLTLDIISNTLTLNDQLTGAGDLTKQGGGTATLESDNTFDGSVLVSGGTLVFAGANQYTGTTTVNSATLRIGNSMSLGSADSTAATGTTLQNNASLQLEDVGTIVDEHLKITSSGITAVYLYNLSGDNVWEENIQLEGVAATRFYVTSGSLDVGGDISGSSYSVEFQGNGNGLQLSGDNVHSVGNTADIFGTVMVSGSLTTSGGPLRNFGTLEVTGVVGNLQNNGTLEVTGTVGNVSANSGTIRGTGTLGNVPSSGTLTPGAIDESGVLDTGNLSTSGTYVVDLDGDTAGDGTGFHDQLNVTGTVSVAGTLQVTVDPGYTPLFAHEYVIIANDDTDAVSGNFSGLTEGSLLILGDHIFEITYSGGDGNGVALVSVNGNKAPTAEAGPNYNGFEGTAVTFDASGSSDPDGDPLMYRWDFEDDGTWDTGWSSSPTASNTWSDDYSGTVRVEVYDGFQYDTDTAAVTVQNVAPTITAIIDDGPVDENSPITVTITATDPAGVNDPLTYEFDFDNDGTYEISGSSNSASHTYADNGSYTVGVRVKDGDGGQPTGSTIVTVDNVAPTLSALAATPIVEYGVTTLSGVIGDVGSLDTFKLEIDWNNDGVVDETHDNLLAGAFSYAHQFLDDAPTDTSTDNMPIGVKVTDDDLGSAESTTTVEVTNLAPVIIALSNSASGCDEAAADGFVSLSATFTDVGTLDTHTAVVNWGDGSETSAVVDETNGSGTISAEHTYADGGIYVITVTLTDDDTGNDGTNTMTYLVGSGVQNGVLNIIGTGENDNVTLKMTNSGLRVKSNFGDTLYYDPATFDRAVVQLCAGDDRLKGTNTTMPIVAYGGDGVDRLRGGRGNDFLFGEVDDDLLWGGVGHDALVGGVGHDKLRGQADRDLLIGGEGTDRLYGGADDDLLISGFTTDGGTGTYDDDVGVLEIFVAGWASDGTFEERMANLNGTAPRPHPNAPYYFIIAGPDQTCFGDLDSDRLYGNGGNDWLVGDEHDLLRSGERLDWV